MYSVPPAVYSVPHEGIVLLQPRGHIGEAYALAVNPSTTEASCAWIKLLTELRAAIASETWQTDVYEREFKHTI